MQKVPILAHLFGQEFVSGPAQVERLVMPSLPCPQESQTIIDKYLTERIFHQLGMVFGRRDIIHGAQDVLLRAVEILGFRVTEIVHTQYVMHIGHKVGLDEVCLSQFLDNAQCAGRVIRHNQADIHLADIIDPFVLIGPNKLVEILQADA